MLISATSEICQDYEKIKVTGGWWWGGGGGMCLKREKNHTDMHKEAEISIYVDP